MKKGFYFDKVVAITGAANGIGRCLSLRLAKEGAILWALDRDEKALAQLAADTKKYSFTLHPEKLDVTDNESVTALMQRIRKESGTLDMWINNAGAPGLGSFLMQSPQEFSKIVTLNMEVVIHASREALKIMESQGSGTLVNVASIAGHLAAPYMAAYCTTKHAVVGFTRSVREELRLQDSPVKMILVSPGFVDTAMISRGQKMGFPDWLKWALSTPEKVANEILTGVRRGEEEIYPTQNGKWMLRAFRIAPKTTMRSSKLLLTRSLKDLVLNRFKVG